MATDVKGHEAFLTFEANSEKHIKEGNGGQCVGQAIDIAKEINAQLKPILGTAKAYTIAATVINKETYAPTQGAAAIKFNVTDVDKNGYLLIDPGFNKTSPVQITHNEPAIV